MGLGGGCRGFQVTLMITAQTGTDMFDARHASLVFSCADSERIPRDSEPNPEQPGIGVPPQTKPHRSTLHTTNLPLQFAGEFSSNL